MTQVVGVRFRRAGKLYFFEPGAAELQNGDSVIVETARGLDIGTVAMGVSEVSEDKLVSPLKKVIRKASPEDIETSKQHIEKEKSAYGICQDKIIDHKLEMKLVDVEYTFDGAKVIFYFTANGRIDFRALVKDLAGVFKTRIELRQIGVRDEAKMLGGLGPCGRQICCGTFLGDFQPVSIKMAKEQNLSLNPTKISGLCGRLMCCLKYEQDAYEQARKRMPRPGKSVVTPEGTGVVMDINVLKETVRVRIMNGDSMETKEFPMEDCSRPDPNAEPPREMKREFREPQAQGKPVEAEQRPRREGNEQRPQHPGKRGPQQQQQRPQRPPLRPPNPVKPPEAAQEHEDEDDRFSD